MDKLEIRGVVKYLNLKGSSLKEIHDDLRKTLGKDSPSHAMVKNGLLKLKEMIWGAKLGKVRKTRRSYY